MVSFCRQLIREAPDLPPPPPLASPELGLRHWLAPVPGGFTPSPAFPGAQWPAHPADQGPRLCSCSAAPPRCFLCRMGSSRGWAGRAVHPVGCCAGEGRPLVRWREGETGPWGAEAPGPRGVGGGPATPGPWRVSLSCVTPTPHVLADLQPAARPACPGLPSGEGEAVSRWTGAQAAAAAGWGGEGLWGSGRCGQASAQACFWEFPWGFAGLLRR